MKNDLIKQLGMSMLFTAIIVFGCKKEMALEEASLDAESSAKVQNAKTTLTSVYGSAAACGPMAKRLSSSATDVSTQRSVSNYNTFTETDFVSAGVGGLRDVGTGTITLPSSFTYSSVTQAYLYWHGVSNAPSGAGQNIVVNSTPVTGVKLGVSSDNCWAHSNSQAYRADITSLLRSSSTRQFKLSDFDDLNPNGASIIVFYNDGNNANNRDVVLFEGNDSNQNFSGFPGDPDAPADPAGWDVSLSGIKYTSGTVNIQMHVGDGQPFPDGALIVNGSVIAEAGAVFDGNTVPGGQLWDIRSFNVTSLLSPGPNTLHLTSEINSDCLSLILAVIDLPAGTSPASENVSVPLDIRPGQCPNDFICSEKGLVTVAIAGTNKLNVSQIDRSSLRINGIAPKETSIQDITSPFSRVPSNCSNCVIGGADGKKDLVLKFDIQQVGKTLGNVKVDQCIKISLTGNMTTGQPLTGIDYITIRNPKK